MVLNRYGVFDVLWLNIIVGGLIILLAVSLINERKLLTRPASHSPYLQTKNWFLAIYTCLIGLPLFVLGTIWGDFYLMHVHHFHIAIGVFITSMTFIGFIIGAPIFGFISDRMQTRKPMMIVAAVIYLLAIIAIMTIQANDSHLLFMGLFLLLGFATGAQPLAYAVAIDGNLKENTAIVVSFILFFSIIGSIVAQSSFAWLTAFQENSNYQHGMIFFVISALISLVIASLRYPHKKT